MAALVVVLHLFVLLGLSVLIWRKQTVLRPYFWPALLLRLLAGISLGLVYTHYYSVADTFQYFSDAVELAALARRDFSSYVELLFFNRHLDAVALVYLEPRALFLTKITSVLNLCTLDNYWLTGLYFSFISFVAAWSLVETITRHTPAARMAALIAFLFLPSVVFWSSGLLKEGLAIASLYFMASILLKVWFGEKVSVARYGMVLVAILALWNLKYYYAGIFLPVVAAALLFRFLRLRKLVASAGGEFIAWFALLILPLIVISSLHPNFYPHRLLEVIVDNNRAYTALSAPEDLVRFVDLEPSVPSLLKNAPWALFSGLFRPLLWEASVIIQVPPAIENTIVLFLFVGAVLGLKGYFRSPHRVLLLAAAAYVVALAILITFSAPNFGTLSRYRSGYFSFFVFIILLRNPLAAYFERSIRGLVSK